MAGAKWAYFPTLNNYPPNTAPPRAVAVFLPFLKVGVFVEIGTFKKGLCLYVNGDDSTSDYRRWRACADLWDLDQPFRAVRPGRQRQNARGRRGYSGGRARLS